MNEAIYQKYDRSSRKGLGTRTPRRRFFNLFPKIGRHHDCWIWWGTRTLAGYGQFTLGRKRVAAHRVVWELWNDRIIPDGMCICHSCDETTCVNPHHLWLGNHFTNAMDSVRKGRM